MLQESFPDQDIRLIDAHSFVWVIHEQEFIDWVSNSENLGEKEREVERDTQRYAEGTGSVRKTVRTDYKRSKEVIDIAKKRASGKCQLCGKPAPFKNKNNEPYLEVHHIDWLSRGGVDSTDNAVALCSNCHAKMHVVDDPKDIAKLKSVLAEVNSKV